MSSRAFLNLRTNFLLPGRRASPAPSVFAAFSGPRPAFHSSSSPVFLRSFSSVTQESTPNAAESPAAPEPIQISWNITRTHSNQLPVYTRYRNGGTRRLTVIRRVQGDVEAFAQEVQKLVGPEYPVTVNPNNHNVVVKGSIHSRRIRRWLENLGL